MSGRTRAGLGTALAALTLAGCDSLLTDPAPPAEVGLAFSLAPAAPSPGIGRAFSRLDRVHLTLVRPDSAVRDTILKLSVSDSMARARLALQPKEKVSALGIRAELRAGAQPLFEGAAVVRVQLGEPVSARIGLAPIAANLLLPAPAVTLTALGDTLRLRAAAVFATGDTIEGAPLSWTSDNSGIVQVSSEGVLLARAPGEARITARHRGLGATLAARVVQAPDTVVVTPDNFTMRLGESRTLAATVLDRNRRPIAGAQVTFTSSNAAVASVTGAGVVRANSLGVALLVARSGSALGGARVRVDP